MQEFLNRKACIGDDATKCADANLLVVGHHGASVRLLAPQYHVTAGLSAKNESGALQCFTHFTAGQVGGKLSHLRPRLSGLDFHDFFPCLSRNRITRCTAIVNIELDRLADIGQRFFSAITLTDAAWQCGNGHHEPAIWLPL